MYRKRLFALTLLAFAIPAASQPASSQAARLLKSAEQIECPVFDRKMLLIASETEIQTEGKRLDDACLKRLSSIKAAHDSPDKDEKTAHDLADIYIKTVTVHARNLTDRGNFSEALPWLDSANQLMLAHYDNGKHAHAVTDNLPLLFEAHRALSFAGRGAEAAHVLANARSVIDEALKANDEPANTNSYIIRSILRSAYQLERNLGHFWSETSADLEAIGKLDAAISARNHALEALNRWLSISDSNFHKGESASTKRSIKRVGAEALRDIASVQFAAGNKAAAIASLKSAAGRICASPETSDERDLCDKIDEDRRIVAGTIKGDISPKGMIENRAAIAAMRDELIGRVNQDNERVRKALNAMQ